MHSAPVLVDTMIVIEAVRTGCWNALVGQRSIITVHECLLELQRGATSSAGYVRVEKEHLRRIVVETLEHADAAAFRLAYPDALGLDPGERDLMALARVRDGEFEIATCDKAAVRAAYFLGLLPRVVSLEDLAVSVGVRPARALRVQYSAKRMRDWKTALVLGNLI